MVWPMSTLIGASSVPWDVIAPTLGGVGATLIGVIVGGLIGGRAQTRHWSLTVQSEACVNLLREYTRAYAKLARSSRQDRSRPLDSEAWAPWNQAMAALNLLADYRIVAAAHRIDAAFWEANGRLAHGPILGEEWSALRGEIWTARLNFVNTARTHLGSKGPLRQLSGRPNQEV